MEESLGLGKKSYGTKTDTETQSWFRLPIPKPGFGRTLLLRKNSLLKKVLMAVMKSAPSTELPVFGLALSFNFKPRFSLHTEDQNRPNHINFHKFCLNIYS